MKAKPMINRPPTPFEIQRQLRGDDLLRAVRGRLYKNYRTGEKGRPRLAEAFSAAKSDVTLLIWELERQLMTNKILAARGG